MNPRVRASASSHRRRSGRSAVLCELRPGHAADHGVHAPAARSVGVGVGQPGRTLGQGRLHALTLHLLYPVAFLGDLSPQSEKAEEGEGGDARGQVKTRQRAEGDFTWRTDPITLSPKVSWKTENFTSVNGGLAGWFFRCLYIFCCTRLPPYFG